MVPQKRPLFRLRSRPLTVTFQTPRPLPLNLDQYIHPPTQKKANRSNATDNPPHRPPSRDHRGPRQPNPRTGEPPTAQQRPMPHHRHADMQSGVRAGEADGWAVQSARVSDEPLIRFSRVPSNEMWFADCGRIGRQCFCFDGTEIGL